MKPLVTLFSLCLLTAAPGQDPTAAPLEARFAALEALDPAAREAAANAITAAGAAAVPLLDRQLRDRGTSQSRLWYLWRITRELGPLAAPLRSTIEDFVATDRAGQRRRAADVLAGLDRAGAAFLAKRVVDLSMPAQDMFNSLASAASAGGEAAIEQIVLLTAATDEQLAAMADRRLESLGDRTNPIGAARGWVALLGRPEHVARAARGLASTGTGAAGFAEELLAALAASPDPAVDAQLARALGKSGATGRIASALRDAEPRMRRALAHGLGFAGAAAVTPLMALAIDTDEAVRWRAIGALQRIGADAVAALTAALDGGPHTDLAIEALTRIGPDARAATGALRSLAARDASRGGAIERALGAIER